MSADVPDSDGNRDGDERCSIIIMRSIRKWIPRRAGHSQRAGSRGLDVGKGDDGELPRNQYEVQQY